MARQAARFGSFYIRMMIRSLEIHECELSLIMCCGELSHVWHTVALQTSIQFFSFDLAYLVQQTMIETAGYELFF